MVVLERVSDLEAEAVTELSEPHERTTAAEAMRRIDAVFEEAIADWANEPQAHKVAVVHSEFWQAITPSVGIPYVFIQLRFLNGAQR